MPFLIVLLGLIGPSDVRKKHKTRLDAQDKTGRARMAFLKSMPETN